VRKLTYGLVPVPSCVTAVTATVSSCPGGPVSVYVVAWVSAVWPRSYGASLATDHSSLKRYGGILRGGGGGGSQAIVTLPGVDVEVLVAVVVGATLVRFVGAQRDAVAVPQSTEGDHGVHPTTSLANVNRARRR
jgi:hypothetical protein